MRKRKVWIEPLFGEAKQRHGLRQFRVRGLVKVNTEGLLIAACLNLKRWRRPVEAASTPPATAASCHMVPAATLVFASAHHSPTSPDVACGPRGYLTAQRGTRPMIPWAFFNMLGT
jgi:hypothetical protein